MTPAIRRTSQFKKDVKRQKKRGKDFKEFKEIVNKIAAGTSLPSAHRNHQLIGNYKKYRGVRECHVEPDWLLIYLRSKNELILIRTGTHADLFE
ncbi:MAG: type II toxin-antitoxin system YafQ family toxin [Candidatus Marinimicrobia bacterium]|nr:type II toxin-antitoxin system YafQ family toxin [Candidatus Neomarinimicrobiota bacterium]